VGEGLGGGAGEPWRGRGGVGRRKKVGEEGGWMDKVEGSSIWGVHLGSDGAKIRVRRPSKLHE
jgi:hypothetical protein